MEDQCVMYNQPKKDLYKRNQVLLTVRENIVEYKGDTSTVTAEINTIKMLQNSVLSTLNTCYITIDIKDMYLADNKEMDEFEYFQLLYSYFLQRLKDAYNLQDYVADNGMVYQEVQKGMYGLPHTGILAHKALVKYMNKNGYYPIEYTNRLWK